MKTETIQIIEVPTPTMAPLSLRVARVPQDDEIVIAFGIKRAERWEELTDSTDARIVLPASALDDLVRALHDLRD